MSHRNVSLVIYIILGLGLTTASVASEMPNAGARAFVGLWQAIDGFDGSTQYLSITCARNGSCDVRLNDTAFTLSCPDRIGFARGEGSLEHDVLSVDLTLYCSNLDGTSTPAGTQANEFVLDRVNGTLTNINDDPLPAPNVFHRISPKR